MPKMCNNVQQEKEEGYKCKICSLALPRLHSLRVHLRDVHKEHAFPCETCGERLPSRSLLKSHVKKHIVKINEDTTLTNKHDNLQRTLTPKQKRNVRAIKNVLQSDQKNLLEGVNSEQHNLMHNRPAREVESAPPSCIGNNQSKTQEKYNDCILPISSHTEAVKDMVCIPAEYLLMEFKQEQEDTTSFLDEASYNMPNTSNNDNMPVNSSSFHEPGIMPNVTEIIEILKEEVNDEEVGNDPRGPPTPGTENLGSDSNTMEHVLCDNEAESNLMLSCSVCDKTFNNDISLATHESLHDKQSLSDEDDHESDDDQYIHLGAEGHDYLSKLKGTGEFTCDKCPISFPRQHMLKMHAFKTHGDNSFQCLICGEKCPTRRSLTKHKQVHCVDGAFKCETCGVSQAKYSNFLRHLKLHSGTRDYTCEWCGQSFTTSTVLIRHRRRHTGEKPYSCDKCGERFARLYGLKVHQSKHVGRSYFCNEENCSKGFYSKSALNNHMKSHLPERPYKCVACGCGFYMSSHYKDHIRKHTGEKPFVCEVCSKSFARKAELVVHIRIHTGERPYVCSECDKAFSSLTALKHHSITHTRTRESKCGECGRVFKNKGALKRHTKCAHNPEFSGDSFTLHLTDDEENNVDSPGSLTEGEENEGHDKSEAMDELKMINT